MLRLVALASVCAALACACSSDDIVFSPRLASNASGSAGATVPGSGGSGSTAAEGPPKLATGGSAGASEPAGEGGKSETGGASGSTAIAGAPSNVAGAGVAGNGSGQGTPDCSQYDKDAVLGPGGSCYLVNRSPVTWPSAQTACESIGAHVVTITSAAEQQFVDDITYEDAWIGATDGKDDRQRAPGAYVWVTGEAFAFEAWAFGDPNAAPYPCGAQRCYEHCAGISAEGGWKDWPCRATRASVCEWDAQDGG